MVPLGKRGAVPTWEVGHHMGTTRPADVILVWTRAVRSRGRPWLHQPSPRPPVYGYRTSDPSHVLANRLGRRTGHGNRGGELKPVEGPPGRATDTSRLGVALFKPLEVFLATETRS